MRIFKGDDTGGTLGKRLVIKIHSKYDLTGCLVIFTYQGVTRKWENVHDGDNLEIFFSHNETMKMSVGTFRGVLFTIDASGKYRTINHAVPIEVTTDLKACYGADELDATVGQAVDWDNVINKPFEGVEVDLSTDDKKLAALGTIIEKLGGTVKTLAIFALSALAGLSGLAYEPEANTNSFTRSGVTYAQRGGLGNSSYVVTNVQMSAGDVGAVPDDSAYAAATNRALAVSGASRPLPPYLHVIDFADSYTNDLTALQFLAFGGCSSFRNGNWYGRTYDWKYTHAPSFVVRMSANEDRFASVGVSSVGDALTEDEVALGRFSPLFKALPCMTLDGINSEGVFANINVVATNGNDAAYFTGDYPALACVRYVLDHFDNALDAAVWVAANAKIPQAALDAGYSFHWMIGDETSTFVVEDGDWFPAFENAMTNFRIIQPNEPYGSGHERYETIRNAVATNCDPKAICKAVWFREAYRRPFTRPTEFAGSEDGSGRIPYTATERLLAWADANVPQGAPESLERNGRSWQSVHSSVYDIRNRQLSVAVQETDDWYVFGLAGSGSGKVKSVNGKTGHVELNADDVGAVRTLFTRPNFQSQYYAFGANHDWLRFWQHDVEGHWSGVLGYSSFATNKWSLALGNYVDAFGYAGTAVGPFEAFAGDFSAAFGVRADASGYASIAIGNESKALSTQGIAIGFDARSYGEEVSGEPIGQNLAIGRHAVASNIWATAVGDSAKATNSASTAIGHNARSHGYGTFNVNPQNGAEGFYIGDRKLPDVIGDYALLKSGGTTDNNAEFVFKGDRKVEGDFNRIVVDGNSIRAVYGNTMLSPNPAPTAYMTYDGFRAKDDDRSGLTTYANETTYGANRIYGEFHNEEFDLEIPVEFGTIATREWTAANAAPADYQNVSNRAVNAIQYGEVEPVNAIAELYDPTLTALWVVKMVDGEMKYTVKTNEDTCALFAANSVLKDTAATNTSWKVHVDDGNMKFFTYQ